MSPPAFQKRSHRFKLFSDLTRYQKSEISIWTQTFLINFFQDHNDLSFHIHFIDLCFYCTSTIISCCLFLFLQSLGISEETSETKFILKWSINEISVMSFLDMLYSDRTIQILWVVTNLLYRQKNTIVINLGPAIFLPQISPNSAAKLQRASSHPVLSALRKSMIHFTSLQSSCELQWIRRV